jgi:hypothetical protein
MSKKFDRRTFMAKSVVLSGAVALGGCNFEKKVLSTHQRKGAERIIPEYNGRFLFAIWLDIDAKRRCFIGSQFRKSSIPLVDYVPVIQHPEN